MNRYGIYYLFISKNGQVRLENNVNLMSIFNMDKRVRFHSRSTNRLLAKNKKVSNGQDPIQSFIH